MHVREIEQYGARVNALIGQGKLQEAAALSAWVNGRQNQQSLRMLEEGLALPVEGQMPALFVDSHAPGYGEQFQVITLSLAPGSATYQAVLSLLHTEFRFIPDGTPESGKAGTR